MLSGAVAVAPSVGATSKAVVASVAPQAVTLSEGLQATDIATASRLSCAVSSGSVYCWGSTYYGGVGNGVIEAGSVNYPSKVVDGSDGFSNSGVTAVDAGGANACAIAGGSVYCWGDNDYGQLGN